MPTIRCGKTTSISSARFDDFVEFLDHSKLTRAQVRDVLNEIELVNSKIHGYGSVNFGQNLQQAYQHLGGARNPRPRIWLT